MLAIDRWAWRNRWHQHHPAEKALLAGGMLLLALVLPAATTAPIILAVMGLMTVLGAGIPLATWLRMMALPGAFLLTSVPLLALSVDVSAGFSIGFAPRGLQTALEVLMRSLAAVSCLLFLSLTTPAIDLLPSLRRLGVPAALVEIMLLIYRLVFVFLERVVVGRQAQVARQGYSTFRNSLHSLGLLVASLLPRSLQQAERMEIGLAARGFEGELKVLSPQHTLSRSRLVFIATLLLGVAAAGLLLDALSP